MKLPRIVRQIGKRIVKATPILRRHVLASSDYRVLGSQILRWRPVEAHLRVALFVAAALPPAELRNAHSSDLPRPPLTSIHPQPLTPAAFEHLLEA